MSSLDPLALPLHGTTLIEASAGTGKTHTITTLYLRLLLERGLTPAQILVVTYTNAATAELRGRVRQRLQQAIAALSGRDDPSLALLVSARQALGTVAQDLRRLNDALHSFDEAAIFTIHGFCQRVLHENAFESGVAFDNQLMADISPLVKEVVCDFWVSRLAGAAELQLSYLDQRGTRASTLEQLAFRILSHPALTLVPPLSVHAVTDLEPLLQRWHSALAPVVRIWSEDRDEVVALLCSAGALKANMYQPESIRRVWAPALDAALARAQPLLAWSSEKFIKFTSAGLRAGTKARLAPPNHRFFDACTHLAAIETDIEKALADWRLRLMHELADYLRTELRRRKLEQGAQSFDDLLQQLDQSLASAGGTELAAAVRGRYPAALIDEFQDTDPVQYDIFRRLYLGSEDCLFLIGDPKQAIYGFRGADVYTYLRARLDAGDRPETLETNRRSDPRLLTAINTLFESAQLQFATAQILYRVMQPAADASDHLGPPGSAALELLLASAEDLKAEGVSSADACRERISAAVAAEIVRLLQSDTTIDGRPIAPADIAVLTRTNKQAQAMQDALRLLRVHSVLQTEESVFESSDALDVQRLLLAIADPGDARAIRAALITAALGFKGSDFEQLEHDERLWDDWVNRFQDWRQRWIEHGFIAAFRALLDSCAVAARLLRRPDGERRLTNVLHLMELLHGAAIRERLGPLALARWLGVMRSDEIARAALAGEAVQIRLESDAAAVKLVTVHKAKGLEYSIVYCPFLWEGMLIHKGDSAFPRFHDRDDSDRQILCLDPSSSYYDKPRAQREGLAENLRLLYVALTRARYRVSIVWGKFPKIKESALGYLLHQPAELASDADIIAKTWEKLAQLDELGVRADIEALGARAPDVIRVRPLALRQAVHYRNADDPPPSLAARAPLPQVKLVLRTSSFSGMTAAAPSSKPVDEPSAEGVDHDLGTGDDEILATALAGAARSAGGELVRLHDFPAGARAGLLIHKVFELIDLDRAEQQLAAVVRRQLGRFSVADSWGEPLSAAVTEILDTPLVGGDVVLRLRQLGREHYRKEMEFMLPVGDSGAAGSVLSPKTLAQVFATHASQDVPPSYAESLRRLRFAELRGFLKGYIDLVFVHGERWYVVDYKSNRLGAHPRDYGFSIMQASMAEHHYFLQYHLYSLAVHRHLQLRQPHYDYARHFGGVFYLFVRGMKPEFGAGTGVFFDRPSKTMIEALDGLIGSSPSESVKK